jgi:ABC-2 type transport system ATP-binding protein
MQPILSIKDVSKTYASGFQALKGINLDIRKGEIFALLGPNGAGKTTLINIICGIVNPTSGKVTVGGHDIITDARAARAMIGLVPQELTADMFETVWTIVSLSRGLWGKWENPDYIEKVLKDLYLWDKKDSKLMTLSGGMKRRVLIAKALSHEPIVLSSTSRLPASMSSCARACGRMCARSGILASLSFSPRITSMKPKTWPTASASSTRANSSLSRTRSS